MHITLTKNMHMKVFFVCLFLFSKIYLYLKKMSMRVMRQERKKMQKSEEKRKIQRSRKAT